MGPEPFSRTDSGTRYAAEFSHLWTVARRKRLKFWGAGASIPRRPPLCRPGFEPLFPRHQRSPRATTVVTPELPVAPTGAIRLQTHGFPKSSCRHVLQECREALKFFIRHLVALIATAGWKPLGYPAPYPHFQSREIGEGNGDRRTRFVHRRQPHCRPGKWGEFQLRVQSDSLFKGYFIFRLQSIHSLKRPLVQGLEPLRVGKLRIRVVERFSRPQS